jgi:hypothetical protein
MNLTFLPAVEGPIDLAKAPHQNGREIIRLDGHIIGDIIPNAMEGGGWVHCFGPDMPMQLRREPWPRWVASRDEAHGLIREALA